MGRDQLAKLAPSGPVTPTGSLNCPVEHVAGDVRQNDGMPPYRGVLAAFGEKIQQQKRGTCRSARRDTRGTAKVSQVRYDI